MNESETKSAIEDAMFRLTYDNPEMTDERLFVGLRNWLSEHQDGKTKGLTKKIWKQQVGKFTKFLTAMDKKRGTNQRKLMTHNDIIPDMHHTFMTSRGADTVRLILRGEGFKPDATDMPKYDAILNVEYSPFCKYITFGKIYNHLSGTRLDDIDSWVEDKE